MTHKPGSKLYVYGMQEYEGKRLLLRFRYEAERQGWIDNMKDFEIYYKPENPAKRFAIPSNHPEVRRVQHLIRQGHEVKWPVSLD